MPTPDERLAELGIELPSAPSPAAAYQSWTVSGDLIFTAGQLPIADGELVATGKLGAELDTERGAQLARQAAVNVLAVARAASGDLARVRTVRIGVFVASTPDFAEQHLVANGASELLGDVLGDAGLHARTAVGVPCLPRNSPVEVEATFEVAPPSAAR